ncbi:Uma2 family endonuclease [Nostoc sp. TCL26-01]|uniref:Uma2 family endonuclease n=1 Tax=Nostoc sp. TCL26-01 TaxID=2576904 RepID=UPI00211828E3|nr:Uma2 family endonuclease [Nostoc sp. TCL26-01]
MDLTDEQFFNLCQANRELRFERTAKGELIIMPPTGGETGNRNGRINQQLMNWEVEVLESPNTVSGEDVLKGFVLNLGRIW